MFLENLLDPKAEGLQHIRGLAILTKQNNEYDTPPVFDDSQEVRYMYHTPQRNLGGDSGDPLGQHRYQANVLNILVRSILRKIPDNHLQYFQ